MCSSFSSLRAQSSAPRDKDAAQYRAVRALQDLLPLWVESGDAEDAGLSSALAAYRAAYGIDMAAGSVHRAGFCEIGSWRIAVQRFTPLRPRVRVLLLHGYMEHSALWRYLIAALLAEDCELVLGDLPGHGLSSGPRAAIEDFAEYRRAIHGLLQFCQDDCSPALPLSAVGHSTGAGMLADFLLSKEDTAALPELSAVVLVAPLCRSAHWTISQYGTKLAARFIDKVPRVYVDITSLPGYAQWQRRDPLQVRQLPLCWPLAMGRWHDEMQQRPPLSMERPPVIIQGDADMVVDWRYNLPFFARKFPGLKTRMIPGGKHQLLNEKDELRAQVIAAVLAELSL